MQNRMASRRRAGAAKAPGRQGNTVPVQGEPRERSPRAPHERDESADSQGGSEPSAQDMGRRGQLDIERGLVDTDKGPAMQETYERLREGAPDRDRKLSP